MSEELIKLAEEYQTWGFSVIPVGQNKIPAVKWEEFQKRHATSAEIKQWFRVADVTGIGIVTGKISDLVVIDVEKDGDIKDLGIPPTVSVKTGGGGMHYYFRCPQNIIIRNSAKKLADKVDIRAEGGYVVAPGSSHPSGNKYEWVPMCSPTEIGIAQIPEDLLKKIQANNPTFNNWANISKGVGQGQRNETAASMIGKLLLKHHRAEWESLVWPLVVAWNSQNNPPLSPHELRTTFRSIASKEISRRSAIEPTEIQGPVLDLKEYYGPDRVVHASEVWKRIEEDQKNKPKFLAMTGIPLLDEVCEGFRKGQLVVVSGPPKNGKTAFCQTLTSNFINANHKCLWFSYELGYAELFPKFPMGTDRLEFYVPNVMQSGNLKWIEDRIVESKMKYDTDIVFIDHLDYLRDPDVMRNVNYNLASYVGAIVARVKEMAMKQNVVVFLMSHIRKNKWTTNDLPSSEELRDTGQVAQLADMVLMIIRRRYDNPKSSAEVYIPGEALLGVMENRHNGKTKKIALTFQNHEFMQGDQEFMKQDLERQQQEEDADIADIKRKVGSGKLFG